MPIASIVLAAGRSQRFGDNDKRLAMIDGEPLLRRVVRRVVKSAATTVVVVTGPGEDEASVVLHALDGLPVVHVINSNAHDGMGTSIATGIRSLASDNDGALIVPGDMPELSPALINRLIDEFGSALSNGIVVPVDTEGRQRNPVLWSCAHFPRLAELSGPAGGKSLIKSHAHLVRTVVWPDARVFNDIDTREQLDAYVGKKG